MEESSRPRSNKNPLAKARGKSKQPEQIWFRRSGDGYRLFLEYYARQPKGVVVESIEQPSTKLVHDPPSMGLSRAAKRRRKRKGSQTSPNEIKALPKAVQKQPDNREDSLLKSFLKLTHDKLSIQHLEPLVRALSQNLPITFRIRQTAHPSQVQELKQALQEWSGSVKEHTWDSEKDGVSLTMYQSTGLSKSDLSSHRSLKELLMTFSQNGCMARQELGSMLPVMALHASADCLKTKGRVVVVDLCASPGSKTLQALEVVALASDKPSKNVGRIIANDVLESRLEALRGAVERSGMPPTWTESVLRYSCMDASVLKLNSPCNVVICDVPCSGDGTIRKDPHVLPGWKPQTGNALHNTQVAILTNALNLIQVGGIVCYSTCSLNPVEDEAVVVAALQRVNRQLQKNSTGSNETTGSAVELLEFPNISGLIRRPGVHQWRVADFGDSGNSKALDEEEDAATLTWFDSWEEYKSQEGSKSKLSQSLWAPPLKEARDWKLERCTRIWPQDQDSGGFFLALIQKR